MRPTRILLDLIPNRSDPGSYKLLFAFVVMNAVSDFTYPLVSQMGTVDPLISPGEVIRGLQMFLLGLLAMQFRVKRRDLLVGGVFLALGAVFFAYYGGRYEFTERLVWATKLLYLLLFIGLLRSLLHDCPEQAARVGRLAVVSTFLFMVIPVLASYAGIFGYRSYGDRLYRQGYKGFIFAINSGSVMVIAAMGLSLGFARNVLVKFLYVAAALLVGTKAAAAAGIGVLGLILGGQVKSLWRGRNPLKRAVPIVLLAALAAVSWDALRTIQTENWDFYLYRLEQTGSLMSVLTSGRWGYFAQFPEHVRDLTWIEWLMGTRDPIFNEIDFTALFTRYGLLGVGWYVVFFGEQVRYAARIWRRGPEEFAVAVAFGMVLVHSMLGGHVLGNAVVAYHVATVLALNEFYGRRHRRRREAPDAVPAGSSGELVAPSPT